MGSLGHFGGDDSAAALLVNGVEDVEKLAEVGEILFFGGGGGVAGAREGMKFSEGDANEAGLRIKTARNATRAKTAAVVRESEVGREEIFGIVGRELSIVVELEKLGGERRVVGEDADGIIINLETVDGGFYDNGFFGVGDEPVKVG